MSRTVEGLFRRLHEAGLLLDRYPEEYQFFSHKLKPHDRAAGAMRWTMLPRRIGGERGRGPTVTSAFKAADCLSKPVVQYRTHHHGSEVEIMPDE